MTYFYPVLSTEAGLGAVTPISTPILSASGFSQVERSKVGRSAILVNGKQLAAVCRIKPLRRLHCCALPVLCWGGAGVPGNPNFYPRPFRPGFFLSCEKLAWEQSIHTLPD